MISISALKIVLVIPAVIGGLWMVQNDRPSRVAVADSLGGQKASVRVQSSAVSLEPAPEAMISRRVRIERILENLQVVSGVAQQMSPERAAQVEMVLDEMVSQCAELSTDAALRDRRTDGKILEIERSLSRLVTTFARILEPELSL